MDTTEPVIVIKDLCKAFGSNVVLDHFDLTLYRGENLIVLGKSGSGKSVLIKCISACCGPIAVRSKCSGKTYRLNYAELDQMRAKVGFLFQSNALYDSMTVRET